VGCKTDFDARKKAEVLHLNIVKSMSKEFASWDQFPASDRLTITHSSAMLMLVPG
jgi:hypothetical protein